MASAKNQYPKWVLGYARGPFLESYLKHPDFIFETAEMALDRKADGFLLLKHLVPGLTMQQVHVAPLREFLNDKNE